MSWEFTTGEKLPAVIALKVFAILNIVGGAIALVNTRHSTYGLSNVTGSLSLTQTGSEHDWVLGAVYFLVALLVSALFAGLAQLVEDTHDSRKLLTHLLEVAEEDE